MRKRNIFALSVLSCMFAVPAIAGWQYDGIYVGDGYYTDDGSRFIVSARGGAAIGMADIQNDVGAISTGYYIDPTNPDNILDQGRYDASGLTGWDFAGVANLANLPAKKDFKGLSFAGGVSVGWRISGATQWRFEAGWDHISKTDYNASPMFSGKITLQDGNIVPPVSISIDSGSVNSEITTDVVSAMAFYDFFNGTFFPIKKIIPYIGFGLGSADTLTELNLSDPYGDLLQNLELAQYGDTNSASGSIISFYPSQRHTSNIAGLLSVGLSYALNTNMHFDFGVRMMYLPRVKWGLTNADDTRHREFFSAKNLIYTNVMAAIRFEF